MTISFESFGTLAKNGSWTGMRGQLERGVKNIDRIKII